MKYQDIAGIVMDMDGVLWRGDEPLPGLVEMFEWLHEADVPYVLATNNSSKTPANYVEKLHTMGVEGVPEAQIVTSSTATAAYLQANYPAGTPVHAFGMEGMREILDDAGFDISGDNPPEVVIAGIKFDLSYDDIKQAALHIRDGATFVGTNPDKTFPSPEGQVPGAGSLIAALEAATDQTATIIGKPAEPMFKNALEILGTEAANTLMIGDRLNTDILGAQQAGMKTALIFTGVTSSDALSQADNDLWPDVAYEGLPELIKAWAGFEWYNAKQKAKRGRA
jgi:4-nitrophenyl phosphatase